MQPDVRFKNRDPRFWANVRTISGAFGYTIKKTKKIKVPTIANMVSVMRNLGLDSSHIYSLEMRQPTEMGQTLHQYFSYRAEVLQDYVEPRLMDLTRAVDTFNRVREDLGYSTFPVPMKMNKQKGDKRAPAYLTGIVNMIIHANADGISCNYDPLVLTTFTRDAAPLRTLARRVDGCFPSVVNPIALWEIKEYYYTTTFGSRVADGVYESLLDGLELEELREHEAIDCQHLLIVDAHLTWWTMGRSYLCRMIDILNMGYVDEILFGYEVVERLPEIVRLWVQKYQSLTI